MFYFCGNALKSIVVILFIFEGRILTVFVHITTRNCTVTLELSINQLSQTRPIEILELLAEIHSNMVYLITLDPIVTRESTSAIS